MACMWLFSFLFRSNKVENLTVVLRVCWFYCPVSGNPCHGFVLCDVRSFFPYPYKFHKEYHQLINSPILFFFAHPFY